MSSTMALSQLPLNLQQSWDETTNKRHNESPYSISWLPEEFSSKSLRRSDHASGTKEVGTGQVVVHTYPVGRVPLPSRHHV